MKTQSRSIYSDAPVPPWQHYDIAKGLERDVHAALEHANYEGYAIGLYAGYATIPGKRADEESGQFAMCFGYEVGEEAEVFLPEDEEPGANKEDPLTDEILDRLFEQLSQQFNEAAPPEAGSVLPRMEITVLGSLQCAGRMIKLCRPGNCSRQACIGKQRRFNKTCKGWKCSHQ